MMVSDRIFSNLPQRTGGLMQEVKDRQQMNAGNGLYQRNKSGTGFFYDSIEL